MAFKQLNDTDLVRSNESIAGTVWTGNIPTLTEFYTSSIQILTNTGQYYYSVYQTESNNSTSEVQFDVAYADQKGSGSELYNEFVEEYSPTRTNYGQYKNLILDDGSTFTFGNQESEYFYVVSIERKGFKEKLLPGTMTINLSGSGGELYLTDDSNIQSTTTFTQAGRLYNLVSGSSGNVYTGVNNDGWSANSGSYGWVFPDVGVILFNGEALDGANISTDGGINLSTGRNSDTKDNNPAKLIDALNLSSNGFTLNSEETLSSNFLFIRAQNNEFNYSQNPSFVSGSTGEIAIEEFVDNPQTFISTVGIYNDNNELLAVAKLSRPLVKDFTKELLLRVKLDF